MGNLTIGTTVLGVDDVERAQRFWSAALDYIPREPGDETWVVLVSKAGSGARLALGLSDTPVQQRPRVHLDLYTENQSGQVERLVALGAQRVDWDSYPADPDFVVLADTEGNRFCVVDVNHSE